MEHSGSILGVVVIGRNEGDRLKRCLESIGHQGDRVVYVDSGSTDASVAVSRGLGVTVLELDLRTPFTAARARNEGFGRLLAMQPDLDYVFFVDGDCEVIDGWLDKATRFLDARPDVGVVCGRRRERYPDRSIYNMILDLEWDTPVGEAKACGGDAMIRAVGFREAGGFRADLMAGEEPELCIRLRQGGWRIWRLAEEMTLHDAAMLRLSQWWRRSIRGGYGLAQGVALHGAPPERHYVSESRRAWAWGFCLPIAALILPFVVGWWGLLLLLLYPLQVTRLALRRDKSPRERWWRAIAWVLIVFPVTIGRFKYLLYKHRRKQPPLIEYK
jgi:glycosyltransferase involved in cell wall biosynthesis